MVDVGYQHTAARIESITAPGHAAEISRDGERALNARWSENALIAKPRNPIAAGVAIPFGGAPRGVRGKLVWCEWRRRHREGLRGRGQFAGDIALRHGTLLHAKHRGAG